MLYIPSMVANFKISFDESVLAQSTLSPKSVDKLVKEGGQNPLLPFFSSSPVILDRGRESFVNNRVPKKASITLPGYRKAATFQMTIDFKDLPLDPRAVRSSAVDIHLGTVSEDDFAKGVLSEQLFGVKKSVLDTSRFISASTSETLLMTALIDEWEVKHGSISEVTLRGRDLRGALLETPVATDPSKADQLLDQMQLDRPIDEVVQQIIAFSPLFGQLKIVTNSAEWPNGTLPKPGSDVMPRHRKGAKGTKKGGRASSGSSKMMLWDLVVKMCFLVGAIPYIRGTELLIRPSRSLYDQKRAGIDPTIATPFAGGAPRTTDADTGASIQPLRIRRLVYGRDIEELDIVRKFGGYRRPTRIRCIGVDDDSSADGRERLVQGIWPPESKTKAKATRVAAGRKAAQEEILNVPVAGVKDADRLQQIAQGIYEEIGRGEVGGYVTTKALASFGGDNSDPDLLRLRPGDALELGTDTRPLRASSPLIAEYIDNQRQPLQKQIAAVAERLGGDQLLATAIVQTSRSNTLQRYFRVSAVSYEWSSSGISITADFQNYVEKIFDGGGSDTGLPGSASRKTVPGGP